MKNLFCTTIALIVIGNVANADTLTPNLVNSLQDQFNSDFLSSAPTNEDMKMNWGNCTDFVIACGTFQSLGYDIEIDSVNGSFYKLQVYPTPTVLNLDKKEAFGHLSETTLNSTGVAVNATRYYAARSIELSSLQIEVAMDSGDSTARYNCDGGDVQLKDLSLVGAGKEAKFVKAPVTEYIVCKNKYSKP